MQGLAFSQEVQSCFRALLTQFASWVDCKLVKHCTVTLDGIGASQNTTFQLSSVTVMDIILHRSTYMMSPMRGSRKCSRGGGGVQIPRRGLTENFNMAKINNLAIPGGGGGPNPLPPPLNPPMSPSNFYTIRIDILQGRTVFYLIPPLLFNS